MEYEYELEYEKGYGEYTKDLRKIFDKNPWVRDSDRKVIPVPKHLGKDVNKGILKSIIREIGITTEEFMR